MQLQAMGVVPGIPDCIFIWAGKAWGFEFKTPTGTVSPAQKLVHSTWAEQGIQVFIVRSVEDFILAIKKIVT